MGRRLERPRRRSGQASAVNDSVNLGCFRGRNRSKIPPWRLRGGRLGDSVLECVLELFATGSESKIGLDEQIDAYRFVSVFHLCKAALAGMQKLGGLYLG